jgi:hypothetical protein
MTKGPRPKDIDERFWALVSRGPDEDCWIWQGTLMGKGYGKFYTAEKRHTGAHRISYLLHHGEIPDGMLVRHTCDNPPCVNPGHLLLGTVRDNSADARDRGRLSGGSLKGTAHPRCLLTEDSVQDIRSGRFTTKEFAELYGVSVSTVQGIRRGRSWTHLERV